MIASAVDQLKAGKLLELYKKCFEEKLGQAPMLNIGEAMDVLRWLINNLGYERSVLLIPAYFRIDDDWIKSQGFSLDWFRNNINRVIAMAGKAIRGTEPIYVVNFTTGGYPVCSTNPHAMIEHTRFIPQLWDAWVRTEPEEKLTLSTPSNLTNIARWQDAGNNVPEWISNWQRQGWGKKEVKEIKSLSSDFLKELKERNEAPA